MDLAAAPRLHVGVVGVSTLDRDVTFEFSDRALVRAASAKQPRWRAPFDAAQAMKHQEDWAKYLGVEPEITNSIGMRFRLPPGEFMMGSTATEIEEALKAPNAGKLWEDCIKSEAPKHKVVLTQPIYLGVHEVTQAQYEQVMGNNPSHFSALGVGKKAVAGLNTPGHPAEMISWYDAVEFRRLAQIPEVSDNNRSWDRLSNAHRGRMGIRLSCRDNHQVLDRRSGRRLARSRLDGHELRRPNAPCGWPKSESAGGLRLTRECLGMGAGWVGPNLLWPYSGPAHTQSQQPLFLRYDAHFSRWKIGAVVRPIAGRRITTPTTQDSVSTPSVFECRCPGMA